MALIAVDLQQETAFPAEILLAHWIVAGRGENTFGDNNCFGLRMEDMEVTCPSVLLEMTDVFTPAQLDKFSETDRQKIKFRDEDMGGWITTVITNRFPSFATPEAAAREYVQMMRMKKPYADAWWHFRVGGSSVFNYARELTSLFPFVSMLTGVNSFFDEAKITRVDAHAKDLEFLGMVHGSREILVLIAGAWDRVASRDTDNGTTTNTISRRLAEVKSAAGAVY